MPKPYSLTMQQGDGPPIEVHPYFIKALDYMGKIQWGFLGTPEQAIARGEMARMLQVYERFGAYLQPIRFTAKRVIWELRFPDGTKWQQGPQVPSAQWAMLDNYLKNNRFPGYGPLGQATDDGLRSLDKVLDQALGKDKQNSEDLKSYARDRAAFEAKR